MWVLSMPILVQSSKGGTLKPSPPPPRTNIILQTVTPGLPLTTSVLFKAPSCLAPQLFEYSILSRHDD